MVEQSVNVSAFAGKAESKNAIWRIAVYDVGCFLPAANCLTIVSPFSEITRCLVLSEAALQWRKALHSQRQSQGAHRASVQRAENGALLGFSWQRRSRLDLLPWPQGQEQNSERLALQHGELPRVHNFCSWTPLSKSTSKRKLTESSKSARTKLSSSRTCWSQLPTPFSGHLPRQICLSKAHSQLNFF